MHPTVLSRPFLDFSSTLSALDIGMFSDMSQNANLGYGAICGCSWMYGQWSKEFILQNDPSIQYIELFGVLAAVMAWIHRFRHKRIILHCNNSSVVEMINSSSSRCKNCMVLIQMLVLKSLVENVRIFARHIKGIHNYFSNSLSRLCIDKFLNFASRDGIQFEEHPTKIHDDLWPMEKLWLS